jgi:predicted MFS family arabinose efflux permease
MATKEFHKGAASYGFLGTAIAIGTLTGALISARRDRTKRPMFVPFAAMNFSLWVFALAIAPAYLIYAFLLPINGFSALTTMISANTYIQANSDHAIRGRIMGIYMFIFMGGTPIGSPLIGFCAEHFGPRVTIAGCAAITFIAACLAYLIYRNKAKLPSDVSVAGVLQS